ncbi:MAG: glycosyltransferase [Phycisphaerae bacterium]
MDPLFAEPLPPRRSRASADETRFLCVASLLEIKGHDTLLHAFARVANELPRATLTLAGDGPLRGPLEALAAELRIAGRVRFLGKLSGAAAVRPAMLDADVFVLASRTEASGVVLIEAQSCGLPIVATRCGGPEAIVSPAAGRLVPVDDDAALAAAMCAVARDAGRFDQAAIRDACLAEHAPAAVGRRHVELYERALSAAGAIPDDAGRPAVDRAAPQRPDA